MHVTWGGFITYQISCTSIVLSQNASFSKSPLVIQFTNGGEILQACSHSHGGPVKTEIAGSFGVGLDQRVCVSNQSQGLLSFSDTALGESGIYPGIGNVSLLQLPPFFV